MTEVYKKLYQTAGVERQESQVCLIVQAVHKTYGSTAMSQVEVKKLSMFGREANAIDGGIYIFHRSCFLCTMVPSRRCPQQCLQRDI